MFSNRFRKGMHVNFGGREYVIEERLPDGDIRLRDIAFDESVSKTPDELLDALFAGQLDFLGDTLTNFEKDQRHSFTPDASQLCYIGGRKIHRKVAQQLAEFTLGNSGTRIIAVSSFHSSSLALAV